MRFLPFQDRFHEPIRRRVKIATTRSRAYGAPGDVLETPVGRVLLKRVLRLPLLVVALDYWREEGVGSPQEFVDVWNELHPRRRFRAEDVRFFHEFEYLGEASGKVPPEGMRRCPSCGLVDRHQAHCGVPTEPIRDPEVAP